MNWKLAMRHLFRHWRLNLVLWTIMALGAAFLAILPMLAISIAGESLTETLQQAPVPVRNIIIQGKTNTDDPPEEVAAALGSLLNETITVRNGDIYAQPIIYRSDGQEQILTPQTMVLSFHSFDRPEERVRLVDGRLPDSEILDGPDDLPILQAAIGLEAAQRMALNLGDELAPGLGEYRFRIVGIVEPLAPDSEIWWEDRQMIPFTAWRRISTLPDIDEWNLSLLLPSRTMVSRITHFQQWRVLLNADQINVLNAPAVFENLTNLQSRLSEKGMRLETPLIELISNFQEKLALAQVTLLLLTIQSMIAVLYVLSMFGSFLVQQSQNELITLLGRGFSRANITGLFARSLILLAVLAGIAAPFLARLALVAWSIWQSIPVPSIIPQESWLLAGTAVSFSWIFLVFSVYRSTRMDLLSGQGQGLADRARQGSSRHIIWELFLLTIGSLAYWQFTEGSALIREETSAGISDPILLLGPFMLLLAFALIMIRLLPYLWELFAALSQRARGLIWNWGFSRSARQPSGPGQITLLISLTAGLTFFASSFNFSVVTWQESMAEFAAGSAVRIDSGRPGEPEPIDLDGYPGVEARTDVFRAGAIIKVNEYQRVEFELLAVDPAAFPNVASYPPGTSPFPIATVMNTLQPVGTGMLPVVIANTPNTHHLGLGDTVKLELGQEEYLLQVAGIVINFPSTKGDFAITDFALLNQLIGEAGPAQFSQGRYETWLDMQPENIPLFVRDLAARGYESRVLDSMPAQLGNFQNDLVFREVNTAFELNALILMILSATGFLLIQLFSAEGRAAEFNVLQAIGLSKRQLRRLLVVEGLIFIGIGLLLGLGIGTGLTYLIKPFLAQILPPLLNDFVLDQIRFSWPQIGLQFVFLLIFYGVGLLILVFSAIRKFIAVQIG